MPFSSWLFKIARNTLIDHYRIQKNTNSISETQLNNIPSKENDPYTDLIMQNEKIILKRMIDALPLREKEIIYMKFYDGYQNKLISKITGLSETNVSTIVHRTIIELRKHYGATVKK